MIRTRVHCREFVLDSTDLTGPPTPGSSEFIGPVRQAWAEVLDVEDVTSVPLDANFLETGGSSLLLIMLWEQLDGLTNRDLRVSDLFQHGTVRAQACLLAGEVPGASRAAAPSAAHARGQLIGRARREPAQPGRSVQATE